MAATALCHLAFRRCFHRSAHVNKKKSEKYDLGINFKYALQSNERNAAAEDEIQLEKGKIKRDKWKLRRESVQNYEKKLIKPDDKIKRSTNTNLNHILVTPNRLSRNELQLNGEVLFGISPVAIALEMKRRQIHRLFLRLGSESNSRIEEMEKLATDSGVPIERVDRMTLDRLSDSRPHQGVCLDASRLRFVTQTAITEKDTDTKRPDETLCLFLDKIHDPMNLGAILRSAYYFGVDRIVTVHQNTCPLTPVVSKASSGAMEIVEVYQTTDSNGFLKSMVLNGWEIVGTSSVESIDENASEKTIVRLGEFQWPKKTVLLIGNEGLGLSIEHLETCHRILTVPAGRSDLHSMMQSLNVGVATGVILQNASNQLKRMNLI